ncbi:unnamed protein product [Ectocarpus sp. 4 AP-2014]
MICGMGVHTWRELPILAQPSEPDRQPGAGGCFSQLKPMHLCTASIYLCVCLRCVRLLRGMHCCTLLYCCCWRCVLFSQRLTAKTKRTNQSRPSSLGPYTLLWQLKPELTSGAPALTTRAVCDCNRAALEMERNATRYLSNHRRRSVYSHAWTVV